MLYFFHHLHLEESFQYILTLVCLTAMLQERFDLRRHKPIGVTLQNLGYIILRFLAEITAFWPEVLGGVIVIGGISLKLKNVQVFLNANQQMFITSS